MTAIIRRMLEPKLVITGCMDVLMKTDYGREVN